MLKLIIICCIADVSLPDAAYQVAPVFRFIHLNSLHTAPYSLVTSLEFFCMEIVSQNDFIRQRYTRGSATIFAPYLLTKTLCKYFWFI